LGHHILVVVANVTLEKDKNPSFVWNNFNYNNNKKVKNKKTKKFIS